MGRGALLHEAPCISPFGHIRQCAEDAIRLLTRRKSAREVVLLFNDLPLHVTRESTIESICQDYDDKRREHHYGEFCKLRKTHDEAANEHAGGTEHQPIMYFDGINGDGPYFHVCRGLCPGCLFRRQSVQAAALVEDPGSYYFDVFADEALPVDAQPSDKEVGTYAVVDLDELASIGNKLASYRGHVSETAGAIGRPSAEVETKLQRLFRRHAEEWHAFIKAMPLGSWLRFLAHSDEGAGEPWIKQN